MAALTVLVAAGVFIAIVLAMIVVPLVISVRSARYDRRRISAEGAESDGTVIAIAPEDARGRVTVRFDFVPAGGRRRVTTSQRTTAAALRLTGIGVGSVVRVRYRGGALRAAFVDALARAERAGESATAATTPQRLFYVTFAGRPQGLFAAWAGRSAVRWSGPGDLGFVGDSVRITAREPRAFRTPKPVSVDIPVADIRNVEVASEWVALDFTTPEQATRRVKFQAVDAAAAAAIAAGLPTTTDAGFVPAMAEAVTFEKGLRSLSPTTPVTLALVGINVAVFVLCAALGAGVLSADSERLIALGSDYTPLTAGGQWWRLLTSIFLHFGALHVGLNMLALFVNGRVAEQIYGGSRYLLIYLCAGLGGSVVSFWWHPIVNGAGASGAIFGIFGSLLAFFLLGPGGVPASVIQAQRTSIALFIAYMLFNGTRVRGIDNAAHIGGLVTGFALGLLLTRPLGAERDARSWLAQWLRAGLIVGAVSVVLGFALATGRLHPRLQRDAGGHPIPVTALGAELRTLGGVRLGMSTEQLRRLKGEPLRLVDTEWIYNSVDPAHDGLLQVHFGPRTPDGDAKVYSVLFLGNQEAAPAELPFLDGWDTARLVSRYGEPLDRSPKVDDQEWLRFRTGVIVLLVSGRVVTYGILAATQ